VARTICALAFAVIINNIPLFAQVTWTKRTSPTTEDLTAVAFGQGVFVAAGENGTLLRSVDYGQTWQNRSDPLVTLGGFRSVAFGNGVFMAAAADEILVSTDLGVTWQQATPAPEWLSDVAYGNNRWFSAGDSISASVNQGTTWSTVGTNGLQAVSMVFNGNIGVAVGGTIVVSQDGGLHWTDVVQGLFNWQVSVAYGNGLYVSVGGVFGNSITKTSDPLTWTEDGSTNTTYSGLTAVAYGAEMFVVVADQGVILRSNGQEPWTSATKVTTKWLRDVTYGNGTFVVVGHTGTILTSGQPPLINSGLTAAGSVGAAFSYSIAALHGAASFSALNLPGGLTINTNTGVISGIPTTAGTYYCTIGARNPYGEDSKTLVITITGGSSGGFTLKIYTAVELEFPTQSGKTYQVLSSSDQTVWSNYGSPIPGTGQTMYLLYSTRDANHRFYRVQEQ
jgi:hypothetical protein